MAQQPEPGRCGHTGWTRELNGVPASEAHMCDHCVVAHAAANGILYSRPEAKAEAGLEVGL